MRRVRGAGGAAGALAALTLLVAPTDAFCQAAQGLGTWTELPIESSSTVSAVLNSGLGLAGHPQTYKVGADYDFAINGPLLLSLTGALAFAGEGVGLHAAPGVKYLLPVDGLTWLPFGRAALAIDLFGEHVGPGRDLGVGLKLGAGLQYWFDKSIAVAPEVALTSGIVAGDGGSEEAHALDVSISVAYRLP